MDDRIKTLDFTKITISKRGPSGYGTAEVGSGETGSGEVGIDEVGSGEAGSGEVGKAEVGIDEVGIDEVGSDEVGSNIRMLVSPLVPYLHPLFEVIKVFLIGHCVLSPFLSIF